MEKFIFGGLVEIYTQNSQCRSFHMKHQLVQKNKWFSFEYLGSKNGDVKVLLSCSEMVANALYAIPGIKNVVLRPFNVSIYKAEAYTWDELYPAIKLAMAKYLPAVY